MKRRPRGFTLLELLLAMMLSALIAGSVASSLYIAFRVRASAERAVATAHTMDALGDIVTRDISNAIIPTSFAASSSASPFSGYADTLDFYCIGPEPKAALQGDCKQVEYALMPDTTNAGSNVLVRRVITNLLAPIETVPEDERIFSNVESLTFSYYDGTSWYDTWDSTEHNNALPVAVQMTLVSVPTSGGATEAQSVETVRLIPVACGVPDTGGTQ
jgi:prepilin-type N-terminal cleavage/methylation domain-containing protein